MLLQKSLVYGTNRVSAQLKVFPRYSETISVLHLHPHAQYLILEQARLLNLPQWTGENTLKKGMFRKLKRVAFKHHVAREDQN